MIKTITRTNQFKKDYKLALKQKKDISKLETVLKILITEEKLKPEETRKFVENAFRDGVLKTTGTDVDRLMPPVSRFGGGRPPEKLSYLAPPWFSAPAADSPPIRPQNATATPYFLQRTTAFFLHLICHSTPVRACFIAPNIAALRRQNWISGARKTSSTKVSAAGI